MKEVKDYIHHYLGCTAQGVDSRNPEEQPVIGKLIEVGDNKACIDFSEHEYFECMPFEVKPILRTVSGLTNDERREVFKIVFGCQFIGDNICRYPNERVIKGNPRWVLWAGVERLGIEDSGYIWADSDLSNWHFNQHEVTLYLLSKHIDLFGLIEAGLAIDEATYK